MCNACVIDAVKQRMLSRQVPVTEVQLNKQLGKAPATLAAGHQAVVDLTHVLDENFPTFFGNQEFFRESKFNWKEHGLNLFEIRYHEHIGTHVDAPLHFSPDGLSVAEVPIGDWVVPLSVVDIRAKASQDADAQLTVEDLKAWAARHGEFPDKACVAMLSGWDQHVSSARFRNVDEAGVMHFPGFHPEAVQYLLEETSAAGIAVDTLSLDYGKSTDFATHAAWLSSGHWGVEAIANLDAVPATGATLVVGAPKIGGGTGGPARVLTLI